MSVAGAVIVGLGALFSAIGAGASASSDREAQEKMSADEKEERRKDRAQRQFQFSYGALRDQRVQAEEKAKRSVFNSQLMQVLSQNRGAPRTSTF